MSSNPSHKAIGAALDRTVTRSMILGLSEAQGLCIAVCKGIKHEFGPSAEQIAGLVLERVLAIINERIAQLEGR